MRQLRGTSQRAVTAGKKRNSLWRDAPAPTDYHGRLRIPGGSYTRDREKFPPETHGPNENKLGRSVDWNVAGFELLTKSKVEVLNVVRVEFEKIAPVASVNLESWRRKVRCLFFGG
jgi:hypothetical protein